MISDWREAGLFVVRDVAERKGNVAARGLVVTESAQPRQPRFHQLSESRGLRCLAATRRPQPIFVAQDALLC